MNFRSSARLLCRFGGVHSVVVRALCQGNMGLDVDMLGKKIIDELKKTDDPTVGRTKYPKMKIKRGKKWKETGKK